MRAPEGAPGAATRNPRPNPFVGPRSFLPDETLFGRETETRKLANLLSAERIVLLNSPSGAGKTSLIQAALIPKMIERGFHVRPIARVNREPAQPPVNKKGYNRYVFSVLSSLEAEVPVASQLNESELGGLTLTEYLNRRPRPEGTDFELFVFDQFEEILTLDPTDQDSKRAFFEVLGELLRDRNRWALFAMREEFVAALGAYATPIPDGLSTTFRLDLLGEAAARQALESPLRAAGVTLAADAAQHLIDDLRRTQVQRPDGKLEEQTGPHVEPVHLQVVGYRLWAELPPEAVAVEVGDLGPLKDVGEALADYYASQVARIAAASGVRERVIREWCNSKLINQQGIRANVVKGPKDSGGLLNSAVQLLVDAYLVRPEPRGGKTWYELSHDRLIEPVRGNNKRWFARNLSLLQKQAKLWDDEGRPEGLYLRGKKLRAAEAWAETHETIGPEREFLESSRKARERRRREKRINRYLIVALAFALLASAAATGIGVQAFLNSRHTQALALAAQSSKALRAGDRRMAALSAYQALTTLPYTPEAEIALGEVIRPVRQIASFDPKRPDGTAVKPLCYRPGGSEYVGAWLDEDRTRLVMADPGFGATLRDARSGALLRTSPLDMVCDYGTTFSRDPKRILAFENNGRRSIRDFESGDDVVSVGKLSNLRVTCISPGGARLFTNEAGVGRIWDARTGEPLRTLAGAVSDANPASGDNGLVEAQFSGDESRLLTNSRSALRLWDAQSGALLRRIEGTAAAPHIGSARLNADGTQITAVEGEGWNKAVRTWDSNSGSLLSAMSVDEANAPFAVIGGRMAMLTRPGVVHLWDLARLQELTSFHIDAPKSEFDRFELGWNPDGSGLMVHRSGPRGEDFHEEIREVPPDAETLLRQATEFCKTCQPTYEDRDALQFPDWPKRLFESRRVLWAFFLLLFLLMGGYLLWRTSDGASRGGGVPWLSIGFPGFGAGSLVGGLSVVVSASYSIRPLLYDDEPLAVRLHRSGIWTLLKNQLDRVGANGGIPEVVFLLSSVVAIGLLLGGLSCRFTRYLDTEWVGLKRVSYAAAAGAVAGVMTAWALTAALAAIRLGAGFDSTTAMAAGIGALVFGLAGAVLAAATAPLFIYVIEPWEARRLARDDEE